MSESTDKETVSLDKLTEELSLKDEIIEDQKNRLLRALADFDNFKKRVIIEQEQFVKFSNEKLILELLPVLDGFNRAIGTSKKDEHLLKGISLIRKQMFEALNKFGLEEIEAIGKKYDPALHEAFLKKESTEEENIIIEEAQKGYMLHGKTIRPSMVIVSSGKRE